MVVGQIREDVMLAGQAFQRTATVLSSLAMQLDHVNDLLDQADTMRSRIRSLEMDLWGADDQRRASINEQISRLSYQRHSLEQQANTTAGRYFDDIGSMVNRMHFGHGKAGSDPSAWEKAGGFLESLWESAKDTAEEIVDGVSDVIEEAVEGLQDAVAEAVGELDELMDEGIEDLFAMMPEEYREYADIAVGNFGDFAEGAVFAFANSMTFGKFEGYLLDQEGRSSAYYLGRIAGDAAAGAIGTTLADFGMGAVTGGLSEAAIAVSGVVTIVAATPGLAVAAVGAVSAAYGTASAAQATQNGVKDWKLFKSSLDSGKGSTSSISDKAKQMRENKANGEKFEKEVSNQLSQTHDDVAEQITIRTESGTKTRVDFLGRNKETGQTEITEAKSSSTAPLTKNQRTAFPEIAESGGTVVGNGKPPYVGGTKIPPGEVKVVRPKEE
ncbi:DNA-binding protein [Tumebacillus sp. DT12]|uniref:DNA-binding protein n=1 Tax=Tumebacillus lacus TaxID=2995335 RepID=A0ABT3WYY8_9BACL|nr:DNA-binding protein [Tumebacillus lacus]MCX7569426.1 DNA-binding protein [Tumebacillus lacus]